jgi:hypothetical protein
MVEGLVPDEPWELFQRVVPGRSRVLRAAVDADTAIVR